MTILFTMSGYSPSGGAERYMQRLAGALQERGFDVVLLAHPEWPDDAWPGKTIRRLSARAPFDYATEVMQVRSEYPEALLFTFQQVPGTDVHRAAGGLHASWLDRLAPEEHALASWFRRSKRHHRQTLELERRLFQETPAPQVITNSEMVARELVRYYDFPLERLTVIANGYDAGPVSADQRSEARQRIRSQFDIPEEAPLVVYLGTGWKRKGANVLAEAFAALRHPQAHLILAGRGRLRRKPAANVHLPGPVRNPIDYLHAADVFALPTLYDPFSNACLEASAHGLPVLTTDANGFAEAIGRFPQAGEVVPVPRAVPAWRDALERWLDPDRRTRAIDDIRALGSAYRLDVNVGKTVDLLEKVATAKS